METLNINSIVSQNNDCCSCVTFLIPGNKKLCLACLLGHFRGGSFNAERIRAMQDAGIFDKMLTN
jgi:hypothetical protein